MPSTDMQSLTEAMFTRKEQLNELLCNQPLDPTIFSMIDGINMWIAGNKTIDPKTRIDAAFDIIKDPYEVLCRRTDKIPDTSGCYCFFTDTDIVYVGTSMNISQRVSGRFNQCRYVAIVECENELRYGIECHLIYTLKPIKNAETRNRWEVE